MCVCVSVYVYVCESVCVCVSCKSVEIHQLDKLSIILVPLN